MTKKKQSTEAAVREIRRRTRRKFAPEELGELPFDPVEMAVSAKLDEVYPEVVAECRRPAVQLRAIFGDR